VVVLSVESVVCGEETVGGVGSVVDADDVVGVVEDAVGGVEGVVDDGAEEGVVNSVEVVPAVDVEGVDVLIVVLVVVLSSVTEVVDGLVVGSGVRQSPLDTKHPL
jgi:hypothetical protein